MLDSCVNLNFNVRDNNSFTIWFFRKQAERDYDVVTGTRYAQGGGVSAVLLCVCVLFTDICLLLFHV